MRGDPAHGGPIGQDGHANWKKNSGIRLRKSFLYVAGVPKLIMSTLYFEYSLALAPPFFQRKVDDHKLLLRV